MIDVLLIGKFPPAQGGIAARTYWLARSLSEREIRFHVVSWVPDVYQSVDSGALPDNVRVHLVADQQPPWFLPGSDLIVEQLVSRAIEVAEQDPPALIETNYLAPFGMAALAVAKLLDVPLLVRHAGSDLAKLATWSPVRRALRAVLSSASWVVTPTGDTPLAAAGLSDIERIVEIPRYVPDPMAFAPTEPPGGDPQLLLAGKLNYHWRLKAIDTLFAAISARREWHVHAVATGTGREAVEQEAVQRGVARRIDWAEFVAPAAMPELIGRARAVWAMERPGTIPDFSNLVSEALAVGRLCLIPPEVAERSDAARLRQTEGLVVAKPDDPDDVAVALDKAASLRLHPIPGLEEAHQGYIEANARLYEEVAHPAAGGGGAR